MVDKHWGSRVSRKMPAERKVVVIEPPDENQEEDKGGVDPQHSKETIRNLFISVLGILDTRRCCFTASLM